MRNNDDENKSYNYFSIGGSAGDDSSDPYEDYPFSSDSDDDDDDGGACWMFKSIATLIGLPKPLGMIFPNDKEKWFLEQRGYEVAEVKCSEDVNPTGTITIAFKKGEKVNKKDPDSLSSHQLNRVFVDEVQGILLKWLLKIGGENPNI